jgi:hypothetical protein
VGGVDESYNVVKEKERIPGARKKSKPKKTIEGE